jgi:hypothetical protein
MRALRGLFVAALLPGWFLGFSAPLNAQEQPAAPKPLSLTADLVLTPEFCATIDKKHNEKFEVGKAACAQLEPALRPIFVRLTRVDDASKASPKHNCSVCKLFSLNHMQLFSRDEQY